ncbi:hypothetical protein TNCV_2060191 [Trichonephila clavipes]|nr:hypothetical protein TNCV_2060191 [Trichonephila clavipes]
MYIFYFLLYKGTLSRIPLCSRHRRIDEADISTPVAVDQRAAKCLEELYGHSPPCGSGVDRCTLTSPSVVHCQLFELFDARRSTASKLASLWNFFAAQQVHGRRIPGHVYDYDCCLPTVEHESGSVMIWAAVLWFSVELIVTLEEVSLRRNIEKF